MINDNNSIFAIHLNNKTMILEIIIDIVVMTSCLLLMRNPILWFFKIDQHIKNQEKIIELLKEKEKDTQ